jgi:hypothetical protein
MLCFIWLPEFFGFCDDTFPVDDCLRIPFFGVVRSLLEGVYKLCFGTFGDAITDLE